jgi:hypothetical protein
MPKYILPSIISLKTNSAQKIHYLPSAKYKSRGFILLSQAALFKMLCIVLFLKVVCL